MIGVKASVKVSGKLDGFFKRFKGGATGILASAMGPAGEPMARALMTYPPRTRRRQVWTSDRQRRGFFALLRKGKIRVPYRRTERLKRGWRARVVHHGGTVTLSWSNAVAYAPGVMGSRQWRVHKDVWTPVSVLSRRHGPTVRARAAAELKKVARP